ARADAAGPEEFVEGAEAGPLVDELLDLVEQCFALAAVGFSRLLPVERLDVTIGAPGVGALALHGVGQPRGRVAEVSHRAHADAVELLAAPGRLDGGPLHRAQLHANAARAEVADDRLARREVRRIRIEVSAVEAVRVPGLGPPLL